MNDKLKLVIDKLLDNVKGISSIAAEDKEYYFEYPEKTYWSITTWHDQETKRTIMSLYLYPEYCGSLGNLMGMCQFGDQPDFVSYNTKDITDPEFDKTLKLLYRRVKEHYLGVDSIFERILNEGSQR